MSLKDAARLALQQEIARRSLLGAEKAVPNIEKLAAGSADWTSIQVYRDAIRFPPMCPVCLCPEAGKRVKIHSQSHSQYLVIAIRRVHLELSVPHCRACTKNVSKANTFAGVGLAIATLICGAIGFYFDLGLWAFIAVFIGVGLPITFGVAALAGDRPEGVRLGDYNDECVVFAFKSDEYARQFKHLNNGLEL